MKKLLLIALLLVSVQASAQKNTSQSYIDKFKDDAIRIMHASGVPASIILAVAMHESGCGNSKIAQNLNNQFGVKGFNKTVYTTSKNKKVSTFYKHYDSVMESFEDFARIMTQRKQFSQLAERLSNVDYKGWAKGIQKAGYCSSHTWSRDVLAIIKRYQLNAFDLSPSTTDAAVNPIDIDRVDNK
ncbi:glucosaminidase domain-containing protein [Mucilaginibacter sp. AW1-3]